MVDSVTLHVLARQIVNAYKIREKTRWAMVREKRDAFNPIVQRTIAEVEAKWTNELDARIKELVEAYDREQPQT